jgi:hypothetical protein
LPRLFGPTPPNSAQHSTPQRDAAPEQQRDQLQDGLLQGLGDGSGFQVRGCRQQGELPLC